MKTFEGIFFAVLGLAMATFHRPLGRGADYFQREIMHVNLDQKKSAAIGFLIGGLVFAVMGMLILFDQ